MVRCTSFRQALFTSCLLVAMPSLANAATTYAFGTLNGPEFSFVDVNETVQTTDDEGFPLFETPSLSNGELVFAPTDFSAWAINGGLDVTHSLLNATIVSTGSSFVEQITILESGTIVFDDPARSGDLATGVFASLAGTLTVLDAMNPADIGTIITFGGMGSPFEASFSTGGSSLLLGLDSPSYPTWEAGVVIDVASLVAGATEVELQLNNVLQASSGPGTHANIVKTSSRILVTPEPTTATLLLFGLAALGYRRRAAQLRQVA